LILNQNLYFEMASNKIKISSALKTLNMSDILALIAYVQISKTEILFQGFAIL